MNLNQLTDSTDWCRMMDPDAEFQVADNALMIVFCGDCETILEVAPECVCSIDIRVDLPDDDYLWVSWDDASDEEIEAAEVFRYVALV